jgi:uncharacterized phage-associated protein
MSKRKLQMVIYYLVKKLGPNLTRTKLVKLLFLIDYIAKKGKKYGIGRSITGTKYYYYHYGPFSREIIDTLREMQGYEIVETDIGRPEEFSSYYIYMEGYRPRIKIDFPPEEQKIIDLVCDKYGYYSLNDLLEIVYSLEEMKKAKPLDIVLE